MFAEVLRVFLQQRADTAELIHAEDAQATTNLIDEGLCPDLILLDLHLPGISGLSLLRDIRKQGVTAPTLVVSASQSISDARRALEQGALGFVSKACSSEKLLQAIDTVLRGERFVPDAWRSELLASDGVSHPREEKQRLTDRQLEVLHLVAQGYANKNIADMLHLSENTVKVHLRETFRALGVTNRTAGVREAERRGYLHSSDNKISE
jgi:DNA-binding NarL/FixJ family response regulator